MSINNTASNASLPSLGLLPGQSVAGLTPISLNGAATGSGTTVTPATLNGNATASATTGGVVRGTVTGAGAQSTAPVHGVGSTQVDPVIASATALNVLNNLTIPQGVVSTESVAERELRDRDEPGVHEPKEFHFK